MKQLPKRGPVILWTGPNQSRLIAEIFETPNGVVLLRAHWPDADSQNPSSFIPWGRLNGPYGPNRWLIWTMEDDDEPRLQKEWADWLDRRDQPRASREDARIVAEQDLGIVIEETDSETVTLR